MLKLCFFLFISSCSHIITHKQDEVEVIVVRGSEREVKTVQNSFKREGCFFVERLEASTIEHEESSLSQDQKLIKIFQAKAFRLGAHKVISNLKFSEETFNRASGLAYRCPHLDDVEEK